MIKFQQSQASNSHFESFWSIVMCLFDFLQDMWNNYSIHHKMAAQNSPWSLMDPEDSKNLIREIFYCNFDEEITKGQCCQRCLVSKLQ